MTFFGDGVNIFLTPQAIYEQLTQGPGTNNLALTQRSTTQEQTAEGERAEQIQGIASLIKSGWQGGASVNAFGAALPLHERAMENAAKLDRSQDLLSRQIDSFSKAANSVRPAPAPPENPIDDVFPFDVDYETVVRSYQSDAENNIAIYRSYDGASNYNETNMPQEFDTSARDTGNVSVVAPKDGIKVGEPEPGPSGGPDGGPGDSSGPFPRGGAPGDGPPGGGPPGGGAPVGGPPPGGPGGQTSPNEFRPPPVNNPSLPPGYQPQNPPVGTPSPAGAGPGGFVGGMPGRYSGGGGPGGGGSYGGGRGGGYGGGGVAGGPGARPLGPGAGVGAGALAAEEAAARRAAQAAAGGRPGTGPMGAPMGGGRGKDDEDTEHDRKYLIEADSEETFGSDVLTAPQVIGDDEYED